ncbi:hypothetical protein HDR58_06310 [bacterium]|nr:hypothetical protein [bacterium]
MNQADLKFKALAIGSLPHTDIQKAMLLVKKDFNEIPFFPQLANINKNEDMIIQFLEGLPSFLPSEAENFTFDMESDLFFESLETFFTDYEEIIADIDSEKLENYGISKDFSSSFSEFEKIINETKPKYAKGQIIGPFTLATTLTDKNSKCAIYDETLRDIIVKLLSLKALWQIKHIKSANPQTTPIIFMDEPSVSQLGTSAYLTVSENEVIEMFREISNIIKENGGICAIHCCGKCDWRIPIKAGVNIINLDAYSYSENLSIYSSEIETFLKNRGMIAWGLVPTLDSKSLEKTTLTNLVEKFNNSVNYLTKKGIDEKLILDNSLITSSCGAGSLSEKLAEHAMDLVSELSKELKARI